ncbi:hypothetical protein [Chryseomicrobium excrementi]|nr:hypothetical protein [Chryseomicrobium excrementi]
MKFAIKLSQFIKSHNESIKIYISVPSSLLFSYIFILGCLDYDFNNTEKDTLLTKYLSLQKGQRVLYKVGEQWYAHSVQGMGEHPISKNRALILQDRKKTKNYVPEERWFTHVRIFEDDISKVRNVRRVNNVVDVLEDPLLSSIYEQKQLHLNMMLNTPNTYMLTNRSEWSTYIDTFQFRVQDISFQLNDFIFDGSSTSFKNLGFINNKTLNLESKNATVVFTGSSRAITKMDDFKRQKCVFIIDRHELKEKRDDFNFKVENDFSSGDIININEILLEYLKDHNVVLPEGVEVIAWI